MVVINKMDDVTVEWSHDRYKECTDKLSNFLARQVGYAKADITFMPISAQTTIGIKDRVPKELAPWYDGPSLLEFLDNLKSLERKVKAPFMMPINVSISSVEAPVVVDILVHFLRLRIWSWQGNTDV